MLKFAAENGYNGWHSVGAELWTSLFDPAIAAAVFADKEISGRASFPARIDRAIAYSALDDGVRPFGDAAIRVMFDDADDLGMLVGLDLLPAPLANSVQGLVDAIVQFAGTLAKRGVLVFDDLASPTLELFNNSGELDGFIRLSNGDHDLTNAELADNLDENTVLTLDFSHEIWGTGQENSASFSIPGMEQTFYALLSQLGGEEALQKYARALDYFFQLEIEPHRATSDLVLDLVQMTLDGKNIVISVGNDRYVAGDDGAITVDPKRSALELDQTTTGSISHGSANADIQISSGDADQTLIGSAGNDFLAGGSGSDTFEATLDPTDFSGRRAGDGDDFYIGGDDAANWAHWVRQREWGAVQETDTLVLEVEGPAPNLDTGELPPLPGITVERLEVGHVGSGDGEEGVIELVTKTDEGYSGGTDRLAGIDVLELTPSPDWINITDASLDAEIVVDMGTSRRVADELQQGETLDDNAFMINVDVADYSGVTHGLIYANGATAERTQGLLEESGITQRRAASSTRRCYGRALARTTCMSRAPTASN